MAGLKTDKQTTTTKEYILLVIVVILLLLTANIYARAGEVSGKTSQHKPFE